MTENPAEGPVSARMQELLSRAVEEQVSEQRQVAEALAELRSTVTALEDSVRGAASNDAVERLDSTMSTVVADLRTATTLLSQRLDTLGQRVESIVADTSAPLEQTAVRLGALASEVSAQGSSVERLRAVLELMGSFPEALSALQRDVAGLHDRLSPLADVQSGVSDLSARTAATLNALVPQLESLQEKVAALGAVPGPDRLRDAVVDALGTRLDRVQQAAERPAVGPEVLRSGLGDLRAGLTAAVGEATEPLTTGLLGLEARLDRLESRLGVLDDLAAAGREEASAVGDVQERLDRVVGLQGQLETVSAELAALRAAVSRDPVQPALQELSADLAALATRVAQQGPPAVEDVAAQVSQRVADRLVEVLAPRISDVVLTRVSAALVTQLGEALAPRLRAETEGVLRALSSESEKRILVHVDEAVLTLAEALLRRKGVRRAVPVEVPAEPPRAKSTPPPVAQPPVQDILDELAADEPLVGESLVEEALVEQALPEVVTEPEETSPVMGAVQEAEFPEIPAPPPAAELLEPATAQAPAAVTTGLAPTPVARLSPSEALARIAEHAPATAEQASAEPNPVVDAPPAKTAGPAKSPVKATGGTDKPAAKKAPAKRAAKKAPAKAGGTARFASSTPASAPAKAPRPRPRPLLEPTPDLDDEMRPVRNGTVPPPPPSVPPAVPPVTPPPPAPAPYSQPPAPAAPPPVVRPAEPRKRKPWWRPGG